MSVDVDFHIVAEADNYEDAELLFIVHAVDDPHSEIGRIGGTPAQIYDALEQISEAMAVFQGSP